MAGRTDLSLTFVSDDSSTTGDSTFPNGSALEIFNGEIAEIASQSDIIKSLECPVCREVALPPINCCENGHLVCGACRQRLLSCALCKASFTNIRNYALESIIEKSKLYCAYKEHGCPEIVLGESFTDHVKSCKYKRDESQDASASFHASGDSSGGSSFYVNGFHLRLSLSPDSSFLGSALNLSFSEEDSVDFMQMMWVRRRNGHIPENAVVAGYNSQGAPIYVIRAYHGNACAPGMICPSRSNVAYVNWFGTKQKYYYEVLVTIPGTLSWAACHGAEIPTNAIVGADQPEYERIYIGRSKIDNEWVCGYIKPSHRRCYVTNGSTSIGRKFYQILVTN